MTNIAERFLLWWKWLFRGTMLEYIAVIAQLQALADVWLVTVTFDLQTINLLLVLLLVIKTFCWCNGWRRRPALWVTVT